MACPQKEISLGEASRVSLGALRDGIPTRVLFGSAAERERGMWLNNQCSGSYC